MNIPHLGSTNQRMPCRIHRPSRPTLRMRYAGCMHNAGLAACGSARPIEWPQFSQDWSRTDSYGLRTEITIYQQSLMSR